MTVLVTGADGYVGWCVLLRLAETMPDERIIGVDNFARRRWVEEVGSRSLIPILSPEKRKEIVEEEYGKVSFINGDLTSQEFVNTMLRVYQPDTIIHLAAQPSAPYSQISWEKAVYTMYNNNVSTLNLLWGLKENGMLNTHFISATTTGVYGSPEYPIPEGFYEVEYKGGRDVVPHPHMAGSFYHMSKCNDINHMWLANKQWGLNISDVRVGIVTGATTEEAKGELSTRFDFDFYFGVVTHRFCAQAMIGYPITVYGKGLQGKPFVTLEDCVKSFVELAIKGGEGYKVYNQTVGAVKIVELAEIIREAAMEEIGLEVEIKHVPNPRVEKEDHEMIMENDNFRKLVGKPQDLKDAIKDIFTAIEPRKKIIEAYKDRFLPKALLDRK
ncbi:UDP-sulfoquinovose synthase [Archaeoglobus sulfaticallidus PM70-1]|uniref:UDP-sulfoquinovose synthase n=1 Tax=Archaeoglobus sulfaticallidus PM70-1 TaxID=387631 RepID=N0BEI7_9EURY|nr:NAD-dependent epimerase/dehydratase family protein [Archaeoglobus sulfaticallidus]AGK62029.1 UDP-sulfoquinovose synthase [Archaeoglobus sulfaticallidus PM70-1]